MAAITNYHKLGDLNHLHLLSYNPGVQKSEMHFWQGLNQGVTRQATGIFLVFDSFLKSDHLSSFCIHLHSPFVVKSPSPTPPPPHHEDTCDYIGAHQIVQNNVPSHNPQSPLWCPFPLVRQHSQIPEIRNRYVWGHCSANHIYDLMKSQEFGVGRPGPHLLVIEVTSTPFASASSFVKRG